MQPVNVRLPPDLRDWLAQRADRHRRSVNAELVDLVTQAMSEGAASAPTPEPSRQGAADAPWFTARMPRELRDWLVARAEQDHRSMTAQLIAVAQHAREREGQAMAYEREPYGWTVTGSSQIWRGLYAEHEARTEARHIGGDCVAFALYHTPGEPREAIREAVALMGPTVPVCSGCETDLRAITPGATFSMTSVILALMGPLPSMGEPSASTTRPRSSGPTGTSRMRPVVLTGSPSETPV